MLAIIGTYRGDRYVPRLMESLDRFATGITRTVIVDDATHPVDLTRFGEVVHTKGAGYNVAMKTACEIGAQEPFAVWLEEDFTLTAPVDFTALRDRVTPHLAQIVLQRQPWFPVEVRAGGVVQACQRRGEQFELVDGLLEHQAFFSGNPSIWRREVFASGWPDGDWSEDQKRDQLIAQGYRFAITPDVVCHHDGIRSGKGY